MEPIPPKRKEDFFTQKKPKKVDIPWLFLGVLLIAIAIIAYIVKVYIYPWCTIHH